MKIKKKETFTQEFNTKGLVPPKELHIEFAPSEKQMKLWKCLEPNSCNLCGGEIIRVANDNIEGATETIPACKKCGNNNIPQIILGGGSAGGGKAQLLSSCVITPYGQKTFADIKAGDEIISPTNGEKQRVLCTHPVGMFEFYRITFEDGTHVDCSEGHLWVAWRTRGSSDIKQLPDGEWVCEQLWEAKQMHDFFHEKKESKSPINLKIPVSKPVNFYHYGNADKRPIDPYLMGAFLGDGCATESCNKKPTFANGDAEMLDFFIQDGSIDDSVTVNKNISGYKDGFFKLKFTDSSFYNALVKMKLYGVGSTGKFIPDAYKYAPIKERYKLIQGLIDTDAEVDPRGHITYTSVSKQLAEDFAFVVRSLGCIATVTKRSKTGYKDKDGCFVDCNDAYNVQVRSWDNAKLMRLSRKVVNCKKGFNGGKSPLGKQIINIEHIGKKEGRCITVDKSHGLYLTDDFTVTHNSYVGSMWILSSCIKFPNIRAVIARKTLKSLDESTWNTLKEIMDFEFGLKLGKHYKEDKVKGEILLWNGSKIMKKELELLPSSPTFDRLGSSEYTIAFVDEVSEISEKGIEVLYSRLRWKTPETFKVPKMFLSTNPAPNWVRDRFVQDKNGDVVKLRRYDAYIQFSVFDNPKKDFVEGYALQLENLRDPKEKQRLLYGNWDFLDASDNVIYSSFSGEKHIITDLKKKKYDPLKPLIFIFDFNVIPQMSVLVAQVDYDRKEIYVLDEIEGLPSKKENNTPAMSRIVDRYIKELGHVGGVVISGDSTGNQRSTASEYGVNNYNIITGELKKQNVKGVSIKLLSKNPPHKTRTEFINLIFDGKTEWKIFIDLRCRALTIDLTMQEKNPDGTKSKKKVVDPNTGEKYEKYGHFSDNFDYLVCTFVEKEWNLYTSGRLGVKYDRTAIVSSRPKRAFNY